MWPFDNIIRNRRNKLTNAIADGIASIAKDGSVIVMNESDFLDDRQIQEVVAASNTKSVVDVRANVSHGIVVFHGESR